MTPPESSLVTGLPVPLTRSGHVIDLDAVDSGASIERLGAEGTRNRFDVLRVTRLFCHSAADLAQGDRLALGADNLVEVHVGLVVAPSRNQKVANFETVFEAIASYPLGSFTRQGFSAARSRSFDPLTSVRLVPEAVVPKGLLALLALERDGVKLAVVFPRPNGEVSPFGNERRNFANVFGEVAFSGD